MRCHRRKCSDLGAASRVIAKVAARFLTFAVCFSAIEVNASCEDVDPVPHLESSYAVGWGIDHRNTRYQPKSSINSGNAAKLTLKWVYGLASTTPRSYPLVTEDTIFVGDGGRGLVALDRATGCERWLHEHEGPISSAILPGRIGARRILIFMDRFDGMYAVDAISGELIWHAAVLDEPVPTYSGTPLVTADAVYVPIASMEVGLAMNPFYGCCTTSGGMAAFDIKTGEKLWYLPTIEAAAQLTGSHFGFVQEYGPSGAPVWASPSYDPDRGWLFFGTGQNYTHPTTDTSDAIFAVDAGTGKVMWVRQYTADDAYTAACNIKALNHPNCAVPTGPDADFGAPTMLLRAKSGRELLVAGQKSAEVHAMYPDTGERVWTTRLGRGGIIGGVHWGLAANEALGLAFVPISDKKMTGFPAPGEPRPGLYALDISTGERRWEYTRESRCAEEECVFGLSAAIIATNDIVVAGSMDGFLEIVAASSGELLWSHDSWREYVSVNGVETTGGAFDAHGPMIADDLLLVTSGYDYVGRQRAGNALLVFQLETSDE
jgi:polyvinyl alcohol dehydrogenase (cytochrome)